jgi:hypothetical protein
MMKRPAPKPMDIVIIVLSAALAIAAGAAVYSGESSALHVTIRGPDKTWYYPLDAEADVVVSGSIGETRVLIHGGQAAIVSSPCGGQTCIAAGALNKNGQWAACLPNRVFVLVGGAERGDAVDAASL